MVFGLALLLAARHPVFAASKVTITVTKAGVPFYPRLARAAWFRALSSPRSQPVDKSLVRNKILLSAAVTENLGTWMLVNSPTATFRMTYIYKIADTCKGKSAVTMDLPTSISICSPPNPPIY
ncbi:MAG: hypothetical protein M3N41_07245 [Acidobacteriota bacterium]|nr:hypothetical protein [Acidobacteriota bacterium]